ncbi:uncharacterized protein LOC105767052 [Gossypium raimondii]|uniref:uncharacterized protein LOC105767052 n=1 Tax=Gossypium raimondii TaxID=29730 RepID=UPI00063AF696|nr:uncharacterized protein LOC105767052 [Gossypium raimondii]
MFTCLNLFDDGSLLAELQVRPTWTEQIKGKQLLDESLVLRFRQVENGETSNFRLNCEGALFFCGIVCVPRDNDLRQSILREEHSSPYAMHPAENKMYRDLHELYWWPGLKREWERVTMDFVSGLPLTTTKKDSVWVIVDRLTKSSHFIPVCTDYFLQKLAKLCRTLTCWSERRVLGPELVFDIEEKVKLIRDRLKEAYDMQKSYADFKRRKIEYSVGDYVFLKVSLWKKILRFGRKVEEFKVRPDLTFEEEPVQILDREVEVLRNKSIPLVKVLWRNHSSEETMWEPEEAM